MKLIYKIFLSNINFYRYFFIIALLLFFFWLMSTLNISVSNIIFEKNNTIDNRKVSIILKENAKISDLEKELYINLHTKKIKKIENNEYEIIFNNYKDVEIFVDDYSSYYNIITFYGDSDENQSVLFYLKNIFSITSYIILVILSIVLVIGIVESFLEFVPDISLLKLLGFSNNLIIKYILKFFLLSFSCLFCFSCLIFKLIIMFLNGLFKVLGIGFVFGNINLQLVVIVYLILFIFILIIIGCLYFKLKKIAPISFVKNSLSL